MLRKNLFVASMAFVICVSAHASEWVGETLETGKSFYLYDIKNTNDEDGSHLTVKFLSHDTYNNKKYPAYGDYNHADKFLLEAGSNNYVRLKNSSLSDNYLYGEDNKDGLVAYYGTKTRDYEYSSSTGMNNGANGTTYQFYYKSWGVSHFLHRQSSTKGTQGYYLIEIYRGNNLSDYQWALLSEDQYTYRPLLDNLVEAVNNYTWTVQENKPDVSTATSAQTTKSNVGSSLKSAYEALNNAFANAKSTDNTFSTQYTELSTKILEGKTLLAQWNSTMDYVPTALATAITEAETSLNAATTVDALNSAISALSQKISLYSDANVLYCGKMKQLAEKTGYPFPEEYKTELLARVAGTYNGAGTIDDFIASVRSAYVTWVNAQITAGYGFPIGTDFSAYLAKDGTTEAAELPAGTYDKSNGKIILTGGAATQTTLNEVGGIPSTELSGNYSKVTLVRTMNGNTKWYTFCSPCDISATTMGNYFSRVMALSAVTYSSNELTMTFSKVNSIVAGTAYLVKAKQDITSIEVSDNSSVPLITSPSLDFFPKNADGTQVENSNFYLTMYGNFQDIAECGATLYDANLTTFILQDNEFRIVTSENTSRMKAFRAYFQVNIPSVNASSMYMSFEEDETEIEALTEISKQETIYNLVGQKREASNKGLYVKNGKVIFIK